MLQKSLMRSSKSVKIAETGMTIAEERKLIHTSLDEVPMLYLRAREAFESWKETTVEQRIAFMRTLRLHMLDRLDQLVDIISNDVGKPPVEALTADVLTVLDMLRYIEKHAVRILRPKRAPTPLLLFGKSSYIAYKPRGVVLVISPWNYPFQLAMEPVLSALVAGNTVILKPSEVTPTVGSLIEDLFKSIDFPENAVQVAHGGGDLGAALVDGKPDYIFFTGSVGTGKLIQQAAAKELIPTTLELGGKDPMIVFADANIKRAVRGALWGALTNSGQVCMSVERLFVERKIYDEFVARLVDEVRNLKPGEGIDSDLGTMTTRAQVHIVKEHVEDALSKGASLLTGKEPSCWAFDDDLYIEPMVIVDVKNDMKIMEEETFGPVIPVILFDDEEKAISLANETQFGLNASVWTRDLKRAKQVASRLIAGNVVINDVITSVANHNLPFGGVKQSGIGRYHGEIGIESFCHQTSVLVDRGSRSSEVNWFPYAGKYGPFSKLIRSYYGKRINLIGLARSFLDLFRR